MTLEKYAEVLRGIKDTDIPFHEGDYVSHTTGKIGYRAYYQVGDVWYWYSVSDTTEIILPSAVANAILHGQCQRVGSFKVNGFEATVRFEGHSFMLNMGSKKPSFKKSNS
jgi:hypothetical protein